MKETFTNRFKTMDIEASLAYAQTMDLKDALQVFRNEFYFPKKNGQSVIYFCGNSLGLQPKNVKAAIEQELHDWQQLAIDGFVKAKNPWLYYQHAFSLPLSKIVGGKAHEVTVMNTLTVNLHLMMLSFYRPSKKRYKILMEAGAFPSDQYAVETQVKLYDLDPAEAIIEVQTRPGEKILHTEDILSAIHRHRNELALVLLGGINYYTGQLFDMATITKVAHGAGAVTAFDLAHAVGNVPLHLHDWDVDFAVWCSYKYLNGGPGAVGGAYIHERYAGDPSWQRLAGWWGNEEQTRFKMEKGFIPQYGAGGWQVSTAQVLNMASLKASLEIFERAGIENIQAKGVQLTGYLEFLLRGLSRPDFEIITPADPRQRGAQLSLFFKERGKEVHQKLTDNNVVVDYREPGVIRVAPAPLYNSFEEVYRFYEIIIAI